jgi:protein tyrosine phosphatase (PTP) superfamily phosphohydrolase (DUF442 family)
MTALTDARNFRRVDDRLATAGQPSEAQLAAAADEGVEVVINLALHGDPRYSLADERGSVESLGMRYVHIPVQFGAPREADLLEFCEVMDAHRERHVLVHCAANFRVTAFLGLYRVIRLGWPEESAFQLMRSVWEPDEVWKAFIEEQLRSNRGRT